MAAAGVAVVAAVASVVPAVARPATPEVIGQVAVAPGAVDPAYGTGGSTSVPGSTVRAVALDPSGRAVVASTDTGANPPVVSVARLDVDGRPDPTFGSAGVVSAARRGFGYAEDLTMTVDGAGQPVLAAIEERAATLRLVVRRFAADGSGPVGVEAVVPLPSEIEDVATVTDVAALADGRVAVGVVASHADVDAGTVVRLGALVVVDDGGSVDGVALTSLSVEAVDAALPLDRLAVDGRGRLVHGEVRNGVVTVRRFGADLQPDAGFGTGGAVALPASLTGGQPVAGPIALRPVGSTVVIAGGTAAGTAPGFVARLADDGALDASWSDDAVTSLPGDGARPVDAVGLRDGGVAVVSTGGGTTTGRLHRFDRAGVADPAFGGDAGVALTGLVPTGPAAVDGDRLLVPGSTTVGPVVRAITLGLAPLPPAPAAPTVLGRDAGVVDVSWVPQVGSSAADTFVVTAWSGGVAVRTVEAVGTATTVADLGDDAPLTFTVAAVSDAGTGPASDPSRPVIALAPDGGTGDVMVPTAPCRVLDTRTAGGRVGRTLRSVAVRSVDAVGAQGGRLGGCAVPAEASAVVAAVSAVEPTASGYLRVGAGTATAPTTTFLNLAGSSVTNAGILPLGPSGDDLGLQAFGTSTHIVVDVLGYTLARTEVSAGEGSSFVPVAPCRVFDDRVTGAPVVPGATRTVVVDGDLAAQGGRPGGCGVPADASAVEAAVSSVAPTTGGYLRVGPAGGSSRATVLNVTARRSATVTAMVSAGRAGTGDPAIDLTSAGIRSSWVVDVTGFHRSRASAAPGDTVFHPAVPCRLADTRRGTGTVTAGSTVRVAVAGNGSAFAAQGGRPGGCGVPADAVAAHVTVSAVAPRGTGYLRLAPAGRPATAGTVAQFRSGAATSGTASIGVDGGALDVLVAGGSADVVVELQGWYGPA